jgi:NADH-quinone oxidoreductase subunit G
VCKAALPQGEASIAAKLDNTVDGICVDIKPATSGAVRLGEVALYQSDAVVRRAPSLQKTKDAQNAAHVGISATHAAALGVAAGDSVNVAQGDVSVTLPVVIDVALTGEVVRLAAHHGLGGLFAPIQLSRA